MRIRQVLSIAALSAYLAVAVAVAAPAARPKAYHCGATNVTILLWPHGHKAIRSVHFPAARTPNIQFYRYDPRFAGGNFLLYADARGNVHPVKDYCGAAPSRPQSAIAEPQTLDGRRAITCTVSAAQTFEVTRSSRGIRVRGRLADQTLWIASVTRHGAAKITFDGSACEAGPAP
jgi:hypothetical protein